MRLIIGFFILSFTIACKESRPTSQIELKDTLSTPITKHDTFA